MVDSLINQKTCDLQCSPPSACPAFSACVFLLWLALCLFFLLVLLVLCNNLLGSHLGSSENPDARWPSLDKVTTSLLVFLSCLGLLVNLLWLTDGAAAVHTFDCGSQDSAGRLTSLEASLVRCFTFSKTSPKTSGSNVFFKTSLKHCIIKQKVQCFYTMF